MTSICENPLCTKVAPHRCTACKVSFYCGAECSKKMWPIHKLACRNFSLDTVVLPDIRPIALSTVTNFQVQLFEVLGALDRTIRIVPPDIVVKHDKTNDKSEQVFRMGLLELDGAVIVDDATCEARRRIQIRLIEGKTAAVCGGDSFEQLQRLGMPLSLVVRISMLQRSLKFCVTLALVIEMIKAQKTLFLLHGREQLGEYLIVRGHVKNIRPRIEIVDTTLQSPNSANEHYAILFIPTGQFSEAAVMPKTGQMQHAEHVANAVENAMRVLNTKWKNEFRSKFAPAPAAKAEPAAKETELLTKLRDRAILLAPAASEADACLHPHRLRKGVPDWFHIESVVTSEQLQRLPEIDAVSNDAQKRSRAIWKEMFGDTLAKAHADIVATIATANQPAPASAPTPIGGAK